MSDRFLQSSLAAVEAVLPTDPEAAIAVDEVTRSARLWARSSVRMMLRVLADAGRIQRRAEGTPKRWCWLYWRE